MSRNFTRESLLWLSKNEVDSLQGLDVVITKCNGGILESAINRIMVAANEPHLPCGFVLLNGIKVDFGSIKLMEVKDKM